MKHYYLIIFLILVSFTAAAQERLRLSIRSKETWFELPGVSVTSFPGKQSTVSNDQGRVDIKPLAGDSLLIFTAIGVKSVTIPLSTLKKDSIVIYLSTTAVELKEVTISADPADQYTPISKLDIAMRGINNSQEILRMVPGLFIGQHAGGGKAEQIFLRGFDLDHGTDINLTVDGTPVNMVSHAHGQGYADLHFLIPETVQQVTFKKGTYDASKGNLATSGFVDFRTIDVLTRDMIKIEGGMFDTFRSMGMFNLLSKSKREKQQAVYLAGEYMHTDGYFDHGQDFNRVNLLLKYSGKLSASTTMSATASHFSSRWDASGQIPDRAYESGLIGFYGSLDPNEGGNTARTNINAQVNTTMSNGMLLKNQLFFSAYDFLLYSNFTFYLHDSINGDQIRQKEKRNLVGYNGSLDKVSYLGNTRVTSIIGINLRMDYTSGSELSRTKNRDETLSVVQLGDITETNIGVYTDHSFRFNNKVSANLGIRYDKFFNSYTDKLLNNIRTTATAAIMSPKINVYYHVNSKTQLYASAGRGFHSNDTRVVVAKQGLKTLPAAYGADLGTVLKPTPNLLLNLAGWYMWMEQEFIYVGDEGVTEPGGKSQRVGVDLSARFQPLTWMFFDLDINYSHARATEEVKGDDYLPLAPRLTSIGGITIKTPTGVNGSLRYRYMGDRPANENNTVTAKGYFVSDAMISVTHRGFDFFVSAQNIFDSKWKETQFDTESRLQHEPTPVSEIHFTPGTPFALKAGFTYTFGK
ncbi:MAG TPA: TonB-dependent receptor [Flavitalea sp.]|nr:TonB-dependent receptor [Flavitalea sp.]